MLGKDYTILYEDRPENRDERSSWFLEALKHTSPDAFLIQTPADISTCIS